MNKVLNKVLSTEEKRELLDTSLYNIDGLPGKSKYLSSIRNVRELVKYTPFELLKFKCVGTKSVDAIQDYLRQYGLWLGMTEKDICEYSGTENPKIVEILQDIKEKIGEIQDII